MEAKFDVAIIGAGFVGISTALHLQASGKSVLLLDKSKPGSETSFGNSGIIGDCYIYPFAPPPISDIPGIILGNNPVARLKFPDGLASIPWIIHYYFQTKGHSKLHSTYALRPLVHESVTAHQALLKDSGAEHLLVETGRISIHHDEKAFRVTEDERQMATKLGIEYQSLEAEEVQELEPAIKPNFYKGVLWKGSQRYTNPGKAAALLTEKFKMLGGTFTQAEILKIQPSSSTDKDRWKLYSKDQTLSCSDLVVAAGPWANALLKPLGYHFPIICKRGYHQHYHTNVSYKYAFSDGRYGYVFSPMEQGCRITTGAEFCKLTSVPDPVQLAQVLPRAQNIFSFGEANGDVWHGDRPCTPDSLPVIGRAQKHEKLWFNFGHGHVGVTAAPLSAKLLSQLITGETPFCNQESYSPARFGQ